MMLFNTRRTQRSPRGVLRCDFELRLVFLFRVRPIQPSRDVIHEARFGQRFVEESFQLRGDSQTVNRAGLLLGDPTNRLLLHEPAFQSVDGR
jgi:hypothetical protein